MPKHCAALPGAANGLLATSTAELAGALLERLGSAIPSPRDRGSRHAAVLHAPPASAPRPPALGSGLSRTALSRAAAARTAALARGADLSRNAAQAGAAVRHHAPSRPVLAAISVTAIGAAAAITATGGFAAVAPNAATPPAPAAATAALTLVGTSSATSALTQPIAAAPPAADLPTLQVSKIVGEATATAKSLAVKQQATRATAARRTAAAAAAATAQAATATQDAPAPKVTAGSGVGGAAVAAAMTKLGKPYSWGAVGPNAFDCSGLMVWAFKQAGVSLPRTSAAQSTFGTAVSKADLRPGDLVFFYSPVSHVGMYIGDGKIVNATQSGEPVKISSMAYLPFHNARRV
jgi:peptidoglycan DL-endopeptidase CwlO